MLPFSSPAALDEHVTPRPDALRRVRAALARPPVTALILGDAGIGKTHLLNDAKAAAREAGYRVLPGRARDFGGGLAYASLSEAIGVLRDEPAAHAGLRELLDAIDAAALGGPAAGPAVLAARLLGALPGRTLLAIDDLHLADADTLSVLGYLPRRVPGLAVIGTARRAPALDPDLTLALGPLSPGEVTGLVTRLLGRAPSENTAARIHAESRGNPWFAQEIALTLAQGGAVRATYPAARGGAILGRLFQRDRGGRDLARVLAALRRTRPAYPTDLGMLAEVAGLDRAEAERAFDALVRDGIVVAGADGTQEFAHPLVAEALYADLGPAERQRVHSAIARLLHRQGLRGTRSVLEWATHVAEGGSAPDALRATLRAAEVTRVTAPLSAAHWYGRTALLAAPEDRGAVLARQALCFWKGSRPRDALAAGRRALALLAPGRRRTRTAATMAGAADAMGRYDEAFAIIDAELAVADDPTALLAERAAMNAQFGRESAEAARQAWAGLPESPPEDRTMALISLAMHGLVVGDWPETDRAVGIMVAASPALPPVARLTTMESAAHILAMAGARVRALDLLGRAGEIQRGLGWGDIAGQSVRTMAALRRLGGEWEQALADIGPGAAALAEAGLLENLALLRHIEADLLLEMGRYGEAARVLAAPVPDSPLQHGLHDLLRARLALGTGDRETAARLLRGALDSTAEVRCRALCVQVLMHAQAGEIGEARTASARLDDAVRDATPRARLVADLCAAGATRQPARARDALEAARADGLRFEEAQARFALGVLADPAELPRAHAVFAELGAAPWRERAERRLREAGLSPLPSAALSPAERRVARLVADGLNNPQIAEELHYSRKTVEVYLTRVYAKTGLHSRVELALAVSRGQV